MSITRFCPGFIRYLFIYIYSRLIYYLADLDSEELSLSDSELPFVEVQLSSYEVKSGDVPVSVRGRLRKSIQFWREIDAPRFILDTIEFGYKLPLLQIPPSFVATNNNSALQEFVFVESAISELLSLECIAEVFAPPAVINPLSVSIQKSGKKRLILDLRHVNQYLFKSKFRCEDVSIAREVLNPGDFMFSFDLKSGYHHVEIFPEHRQYLSFSWNFSSGVTRYFQFSVLPFGLSSAPYLFTKLLKPLVKKWRTEGKSIVVFLDDGLGAAADHTNARISSLSVHADLLKSGFVPNEEKSLWEPTQVITWLGTVIDTSQCIISATDTRIQSLSEDLSFLLDATHPSLYRVRKLASVCGKIISLGNCVGNVARLMTRNIFAVVNSATNWSSMVSLTPGCVEELNFWKVNLVFINGVPLWPIKRKPSRIVYSDASISACGSFITLDGKVFHQNWSDFERSQSSTFCELLAVLLSLQAFIDSLRAQTVVWYTDNQNVARIVSIGSKVPALQRMALDIHRLCLLASVSIDMQWIPRDLNIIADDISKFVDLDDYSINDGVFYSLDDLWGPHTCDRFACHYNAKLPKFNTRFYQPGTSGVNAFAQDWSNDNNWLCPPVCLTCKVLSHLKVCNAAGTLVVPLWRSAHFWPRLCFDGLHWSGFVHDWVILPDLPNLFVRGKAKNSIFGRGSLPFPSVALRIDFTTVPRQGSGLLCEVFRVPDL